MNQRDQALLAIRPEIASLKINAEMSDDERFQNCTIRPILKLQNNLFIHVFENYIAKHKNVFYQLSIEKRLDYIENAIHKDTKFRNALKGMIIGQFTSEEYALYITNSSALNKRMMNLTKQRLLDQIQVFELPEWLNAV